MEGERRRGVFKGPRARENHKIENIKLKYSRPCVVKATKLLLYDKAIERATFFVS